MFTKKVEVGKSKE